MPCAESSGSEEAVGLTPRRKASAQYLRVIIDDAAKKAHAPQAPWLRAGKRAIAAAGTDEYADGMS